MQRLRFATPERDANGRSSLASNRDGLFRGFMEIIALARESAISDRA